MKTRTNDTRRALLKAAMALEEALRVLEIPRVDDAGQLKTAYRNASRKHHPDRGGNVEVMKRVNEAYELLTKFAGRGGGGVGFDPSDRSAERAKIRNERERALIVVNEAIKEAFHPEKFTSHFEKTLGKPFTAHVDRRDKSDSNGPLFLTIHTTWRSEDSETVFTLVLTVTLSDVLRVKALGGAHEENFAFPVSVSTSNLHEGRKSKFQVREYKYTSNTRTVMDPEDLFPTAKMRKMAAGKEKARKFSRRDMYLGLDKLLGATVNDNWAFIPLGAPDTSTDRTARKFPGAHDDRFILRMWRTSIDRVAGWSIHSIQGPHMPKVGRESFNVASFTLYETDDLLKMLVDVQRKARTMSSGPQIAKLVYDASVDMKESGRNQPPP